MQSPSRLTGFTVVVRNLTGSNTYKAIGTDAATVHIQALARFGACGVTVTPIAGGAR